VVSRVADEDNWRQIKETLIQNAGTATIPVIKVEDSDYLNNRTLLLKHDHDGRDLQLEYAERTLKYVQQLWGHDVVMETIVDSRPTLLTFADGKFTIRKAA
jgi:stage V sporulation protein R